MRPPISSTSLLAASVLLTAACSSDDGIRVAPPTGDVDQDRASIQAAVDSAQPGDVVQLGAGTYVSVTGPSHVVDDRGQGNAVDGAGGER